MKYIDSEKLMAEIERRLKIVEPHKDTFESAAACRQELIWMKELITSLQQEQPIRESHKGPWIEETKKELQHEEELLDMRLETLRRIRDKKNQFQQEQPKDKQIVIITESHGDANIEWDCRSLDDVIALLNCAESFITEKQIEKIAGPGSGPDYATTEGRYSYLFKRQQEQPEVDLEEAYMRGFAQGAKEERAQIMDEWLKDRDGCFWDGVREGKAQAEKKLIPLINRLCEAILFEWKDAADLARKTLTQIKAQEE